MSIASRVILGLLAGLSLVTGVQASSITLETRAITNTAVLPSYQGAPGINYQTGWQAQTSTISSSNLSAVNNVYAGNGSFTHLSVQFSLGSAGGALQFQLAPDAGYGGALYLDGQLLDQDSTDLWWGMNWNSTAELLTGSANLSSGTHLLEAYWSEGCCNGASAGRFNLNNTGWQELSVANLNALPAATVPLPGVLPLLGLGLVGMTFVRRRRG